MTRRTLLASLVGLVGAKWSGWKRSPSQTTLGEIPLMKERLWVSHPKQEALLFSEAANFIPSEINGRIDWFCFGPRVDGTIGPYRPGSEEDPRG